MIMILKDGNTFVYKCEWCQIELSFKHNTSIICPYCQKLLVNVEQLFENVDERKTYYFEKDDYLYDSIYQ